MASFLAEELTCGLKLWVADYREPERKREREREREREKEREKERERKRYKMQNYRIQSTNS